MDILIILFLQYFRNVEEIEWAIELALEYGKPVAATMCMGPKGDAAGIPVGECAVRMARAGTNLVKKLFKSELIRSYAKLFSKAKEGRRVAKPNCL